LNSRRRLTPAPRGFTAGFLGLLGAGGQAGASGAAGWTGVFGGGAFGVSVSVMSASARKLPTAVKFCAIPFAKLKWDTLDDARRRPGKCASA